MDVLVREFQNVLPEDLPGVVCLPVKQLEFRINLIPGVALIAKASYHLALP